MALAVMVSSGVCSWAQANYTPVSSIVLTARDPDSGEVIDAWAIGQPMVLHAVLSAPRPEHPINFRGTRGATEVYWDIGYPTPTAPTVAQVQRVEGSVGTTAFRATDKSTKPGVADTLSNVLNVDFFNVAVLVNATPETTDDYVVKRPATGMDRAPRNIPAGATDNHIPLQLKLSGPGGKKLKLKVASTDTGGRISITKNDGGTYPAEGIEVTVGNLPLDLRLHGTTSSSALGDVKINVTGDRTRDRVWMGSVTVIWTPGEEMKFRGTQPPPGFGGFLSGDSEAQLAGTNFTGQLGELVLAADRTTIRNFEEIEMVPHPKVLIPNVSWDICRQISRAAWSNGGAPMFNGKSEWNDDGPSMVNGDKDVTQQAGKLSIFSVDGPGPIGVPTAANDTYSYKGKFREWNEVEIGGKWYVCSEYIFWRSIMHLKPNEDVTRWIGKEDTENEIVRGTIEGFADTWVEQNPAPAIDVIVPATGTKGNTVTITNLAGTNFVANATIVLAKTREEDIPATDVEWQSDTQYTCTFVLPATAAIGDWDVKLTNIDNPTTAVESAGFSITAPQ